MSGLDHAAELRRAQQAVRATPNSAHAWRDFGEELRRAGAALSATNALQRAALLSGSRSDQYLLARALAESAQFDRAIPIIAELPTDFADDAEMLVLRARIFTLAGMHNQALASIKAARELRPENSTLLYNVALARRACGDFAGAVTDLDKVISLNPSDWTAWKIRSDLRQWNSGHNHISEIKARLVQHDHDLDARILLGAALAKELTDLGDHEAGFAALVEAAALRRRQLNYDVAEEIGTMRAIARNFTKELLADTSATVDPSHPRPIFIVGLPRSGSTLLERILAASPDIDARGEMSDFPKAMTRHIRAISRDADLADRSSVELASHLDNAKLGSDYLTSVAARGGKARWFVDKLPMNFLNIGLISLALPDAVILHVHRKPKAACYSIFKAFFGDAHPYSYDMIELADYYTAYLDLMDHWRKALPTGKLIEIAYEELATNSETVCVDAFNRLGVQWQPAFLSVEHSHVPTDTASASQVAEPIHARSLEQWQPVARELAPMFARLAANGVQNLER